VKNSEEEYDFIEEIFEIAEGRNKVPAFQLAEGKGYCNYASAYQTMTADYEKAKQVLLGDIGELAFAQEKSIIRYISDKEINIFGNDLGKKYMKES